MKYCAITEGSSNSNFVDSNTEGDFFGEKSRRNATEYDSQKKYTTEYQVRRREDKQGNMV